MSVLFSIFLSRLFAFLFFPLLSLHVKNQRVCVALFPEKIPNEKSIFSMGILVSIQITELISRCTQVIARFDVISPQGSSLVLLILL